VVQSFVLSCRTRDLRLLTGGHIAVVIFLWENLMTFGCFCDWPIGVLANNMHGNPDARATRNRAQQHAWKSQRHSPHKLPLCMWGLDPIQIHGSLWPTGVTSQMASQSVQLLLQDLQSWLTDRQTRYSVCSNRPHLASSVMRQVLLTSLSHWCRITAFCDSFFHVRAAAAASGRQSFRKQTVVY